MSLYDLFRGFFRGGQRPQDPFFGGITRDEDEDDEDEDGPSFGAQHPGDFGFGFSFGPGGMHFHNSFGFEELFQDFNDLFHEMGAWSLPTKPFEHPGLETPPAPGEKRQTLRDFMLKYPESSRSPSGRGTEDGTGPTAPSGKPVHPYQGRREIPPSLEDIKDPAKEDRDLDSHVTSKGLETILPPAQSRSYFRSVSVTKVVAPDGTVEERRTVRDSEGHEETIVTRQSREGTPQSFDGSSQRGSGTMDDTSSILDTFFRWWFPGR